MGSVLTTLYMADGIAEPVEVKTQARIDETPRTFDARHLDELEASFGENKVEVKAHPARSRDVLHWRVSGGVELQFPIDHKEHESAEAFQVRTLHVLAKYALAHPGDV